MHVRHTLIAILDGILPARSAPLADDDNLFALGCTSLMAVAIIDRVNRALGVDLSILALVSAPTLAGLEAVVTQAGGAEPLELEEGEL
jgi:aryl carrier-like protein